MGEMRRIAIELTEEQWWILLKLEPHEKRIAITMEALRQLVDAKLKPHCTCHERDSSYVCDYCYAQGLRGHMQE